MNAPVVPERRSRAGHVLAGVLVVLALLVTVGFVFDLPYGFGGWTLAIIAAPVALAAVALGVVLRTSDRG